MSILWSNGWTDQDATWYGDRSPPRRHCVRRERSLPPPAKKGAPNLEPMSVVVKRLDASGIGTEVGSGPDDIVLDENPQRSTAPNFRPKSVVAKRLDGSRCHWVGR